ncbi:MAG: hypothetical protein IT426_11895 [Pirellulales bacterium]|nr:hypothetical protein [Pirellulales bacterium]
MDKQIRCRFQNLIAEHYPGLKVDVRSAEFVAGEGIRIRGFSIADPSADGPRAELLSVEEIFLSSKTELKDLLVRDPIVTRVVVRHPTLHGTRRRDGSWSAAKLLPPPKFGHCPPEVSVENGTIEIFDPTKSPSGALTLRDVNLKVHPAIETARDGTRKEIRDLQGMFACDYLRRVEFRGTVDAQSGAFTFSGTTQGLDISPELRDALPEPLCAKIHAWGELRAEGKFDFQVAYDPTRPEPPAFRIDGSIERGRIDDPRCPHPLSEVAAKFSADNSGFLVEDLTAKIDRASLKIFRYECRGYEPSARKHLQAEVRQLELDRALFGALPEPLRAQWEIYRPAGRIDADLRLDFDGEKWAPEITVRSSNLSFTHADKFQYRFERGTGFLTWTKNRLTLDATAQGGNRPIRLKAEVTNPLDGPTHWFEARGEAFPLDENLFRALKEKPQNVVRSLDPRGTVDFYFHSSRDVPGGPPHQHLLIEMNRCSIRFHKFPYPISDVRGKLVMFDDQWDFFDLEGANNTTRITGKGSFRPTMEGNQLELQLAGKGVLLEQDLRNALPPNIQAIWRDLKPAGAVDLVTSIAYLAEKKQLSVGVTAEPQKDTASIEPVYFPYRMEKLQGKLIYRDGHVTLQKLRGWHGGVELGAEGICDFHPAGPWEMHFKGLYINGLDRELIQALPERLRKAVLALNPSRPPNANKSLVNLHGDLDFYHVGLPGEPLQSRWDIAVNLFQNELQCGVKLENIAGKIMLKGHCDGRHVGCRGELALDSVNFKDYQFTNVSGPLWIDDDRVLLGNWVDDPKQATPPPPAEPPRPPRSISANLFEGIVRGKGWIKLGTEPRYGLEATLQQANLARIIPGRQNLQGKIDAGIGLKGNGSSRNGLQGAGAIRVSDAYVYELPAMMQLLKILRFRPPDRNAFSKIDVGYRIEGEHIYFDTIHFDGDAISLHGKGDMDWQANLNVNLSAGITRNDSRIPIFGPVISDTSRGAMLFRVRGPLQNPNIEQVALPAMNQAIQQLQERRK